MLTVRRADRQERDKMHLENRAFMMDLKQGQKDIETTMEILPLHGHTEADGPLHSHGIYRPKR
jgi:hypothetical protein